MASVDNIYKLDRRVPAGKAIPFGLQHVLAMFVANVTPVMLIASVAVYNGQAFTAIDTALLIQAAMLVAGIGTLVQLFPVWRIGSRLPVVMGLSFTFLSAMMTLAAKDYGYMIGAVIVGGCIEGLLGLTAKYWRRFVSPIVSACVVTTIGFSLLSTGISSFASSSVYPTGAWQNLLVAVITLAACLVYNSLAKGFWKQLYVLFGAIIGVNGAYHQCAAEAAPLQIFARRVDHPAVHDRYRLRLAVVELLVGNALAERCFPGCRAADQDDPCLFFFHALRSC